MIAFGAVQLVIRLRWFVTLPILTRTLGPEGYGQMAALLAFAGLITNLTLSGLNTSLPIYLPRLSPDERSRDFSLLLRVAILTAITAGIAVTIAHPLLVATALPPDITRTALVIAMLFVAASTGYGLAQALVISERAGVRFARTVATFSVLEAALMIGGAMAAGALGVVLAMSASMAGQTIVIARAFRQRPEAGRWRWDPARLRRLFPYYRYGVAVLVVGLGGWVLESSDRLIIGRSLGTEPLGIYYVAYGIAAQAGQLSGPIFAGLMPFLVEAVGRQSTESARGYLRSALRLLLLVFAPLLALATIASHDALSVVASSAFAEGAVVVPLVVLATAALQLAGLYAYVLHAHRRGPLMAAAVLAGGGLNIALNLLLIPRFGIVAAAWTTLAGYTAHLLVTRALAERYLRLPWSWTLFARVIAATVPMVILLLIVQSAIGLPTIRLVVSVAGGGLVFAASCVAVRVVTISEVRGAARILRGMSRASGPKGEAS